MRARYVRSSGQLAAAMGHLELSTALQKWNDNAQAASIDDLSAAVHAMMRERA